MFSRRQMVMAIGAGALASFSAHAQQPGKIWRLGFHAARSRSTVANPDRSYDAFVEELHKLGYVEGRNLTIEWRFAESRYERLPALAQELVALNVDAIATHTAAATKAAQRATKTIPIVTALVAGDMVSGGYVASLARPGGNLTGLSEFTFELTPKRLELIKETLPLLSLMGVLMNTDNPDHKSVLKLLLAQSEKMGVKLLPFEARNAAEIESSITSMAQKRVGAVFVFADGFFLAQGANIARFCQTHRLPSTFPFRESVDSGGLMSYGSNLIDNYRRAAAYIDKIFKGAKPGEIPIEQPTKVQLVINMKTAKSLGVKIPKLVMLRTDDVIE